MGVILDTSAVIGLLELPHDRALLIQQIKAAEGTDRPAVSIVTLGELAVGVHAAADPGTAMVRQRSLEAVAGQRSERPFDVLPIDDDIWRAFGAISSTLSRKIGHNDKWIAATALATDRLLLTQDEALADAASAVRRLHVALVPRQ